MERLKLSKRYLSLFLSLLIVFSSLFSFSAFPMVVSAAGEPDAQAKYYVSPTGSDSNDGSIAAPFQTIEKARDVVRTINKDMNGDIYVYLRGGDYRLTSTINFGLEDSGTNGHRIYYQAYPGETPVLNGSKKVTGWSKSGTINGIDGIYEASLDRSTKLRYLFVNDKRAQMTKLKATGQGGYGTYTVTKGQADWAWTSGSNSDGVKYNLSDVPEIANNKDDLEIVNGSTWNENVVCTRDVITSSDGKYRVLQLQQPYGSIAQLPGWGAAFTTNSSNTIYNAIEFMKNSGEFYFDKTAKKLYYYPREGENMASADVEAPFLEKLIDLKGTSNSDRIKNITFQGITFANTDWNLIKVGDSYGRTTCQSADGYIAYYNQNWHDSAYTILDTYPGIINIKSADSIDLRSNIIKHSGADGVSMVNDVINSKLIGNYIYDITASGITVGHPQHVYLDDTMDKSADAAANAKRQVFATGVEGICTNDVINNNMLWDCSTAPGFGGCAGITSFFSDKLKITHNTVHTSGYNGITLGWGWCNFLNSTSCKDNDISYNRVYNALNRLHDSGAIYTIGQMPGTTINENYVKGIPNNSSGPTYGLHNDEGTAYITENDNVLDIDPGVTYTINCEDYGQKHDLTIHDTYATVYKMGANPPKSTIDAPVVVPDNVWPMKQYNIALNAGVEEQYRNVLPGNLFPVQDYVFPASCSTTGGSISIRSSGDAANTVWFAPDGTTTFTEGTKMTKAAGDAIAINAPADAGAYKLYVLDSTGKVIGKSNALLRVNASDGSNNAPKASEFKTTGTIGSQWSVVNEDKANYSVTAGSGLKISTQAGDMSDGSIKNMFQQNADGDWVAQTKVTLSAAESTTTQAIGLAVYGDSKNYLKLDYERGSSGSSYGFYNVIDGVTTTIGKPVSLNNQLVHYFRIVKSGTKYSAYYSTDGGTFNFLGSTASIADPKLGLIACNGAGSTAPSIDATFEYLKIGSESDLNGDVTLSELNVDGTLLSGFTPDNGTYSIVVPRSLSTVPVVTAKASSDGLDVSINAAKSLPGVTTVTVSSNLVSRAYNIIFEYAPTSCSFMNGTMDSDWTVLRENKDTYSLVKGEGLRLPTQRYDIYSSSHDPWENLFTRQAAGDWDVVSKVYYPVAPSATYQQQALLVWQDEDNYIKVACQYNWDNNMAVQMSYEKNGSNTSVKSVTSDEATAASKGGKPLTIYYRIKKTGNSYEGLYSLDGKNYTSLGSTTFQLNNICLGLLAVRNSTNASVDSYCQGLTVLSATNPSGSIAPTWPSDSTLKVSGISTTGLTLTWPAAQDDKAVTGYNIFNGTTYLATVDGSTHSYDITGLTPGTSYDLKVEALDADGCMTANGPSITSTTQDTPDITAPVWPEKTVLASDIYSNGLTLSWSAAQDDKAVTEYRIYRDSDLIKTVSGSAMSCNVEGLSPDTSYKFKIEAGDKAGNWSSDGPEGTFKTNTDIRLEAENATLSGGAAFASDHKGYSGTGFVGGLYNVANAKLSFNVNVASAGQYRVKLRYSMGFSGQSTNMGLYVNGVKITGITCPSTSSNWDMWSDETETVTLNSGDNTIAYNADTASTNCINIDYITITKDTGTEDITAPVWSVGSALTVSNLSSKGLTLTWPAANDDTAVTGYKIYKDSELIATLTGSAISYDVKGLTPDTAYTFKVEAGDAAGNWSTSGPSIQATTLKDNTPEDKTAPTWPDGSKLVSSNVTSNGLTVTWTPAQDNTAVAGYRVYNGSELIATVNGATADHYDVTGLTANTAYTFKVEAGDAAGNWSTNGPTVSVTTGAGGSNPSGYIPPNNETPATQTTPVTNVTPATDGATVKDGVITVQSKVTDSVVSAEVSKDTIDKALSSSQVAKIVVPAANGAKEYVQTLPVSSLQAADSSKKIVIETPAGTAVVPVNALKAEAIQQKTVDISLAASGSAALSQGLKDQIGNRPVVDVSIKAGSSNIAISNPLTPVTVSIDYKPTADELKDSEHIVVWSIDNNGEAVPVTSGKYDAATGKVTFTATESGKYAVTYVEKTFEDTAKTKWAEKPIEVLASKGIAGGTSATSFSPEKSITRADYLTMLMKALGLKSDATAAFDDVKQDAYYFNAVATAKMLGITDGTGDNKFSPDKLISRQDMIVMTEKALKVAKELAQKGSGADLDKFSDKSDISGYAIDSIAGFVNAGLISGSDGKINPRQNTTRAEAAVIIYKIYNK